MRSPRVGWFTAGRVRQGNWEIEAFTKVHDPEEIKSELQNPFPDPRGATEEFSRLTPTSQVVKMLTGKDESWWYMGRPVTIKLLNPLSRTLAQLVDANGLIVGSRATFQRTCQEPPVHAYLTKIDLNKLMVDVAWRNRANREELLTQFVRFDPFYNFNRAAMAKSYEQSCKQQQWMKSVTITPIPAVSTRQLESPGFQGAEPWRRWKIPFISPCPISSFVQTVKKRIGGDLPGDLTLTWKS